MIKIGRLKLSSRFILAPMAGITDLPFRLFNRKFGCEFAFVEMINVRSLSYKSKRTKSMLDTTEADNPLGVQILGAEPQYILKGLDIIKQYDFEVLDFNAACPMRKIINRGEGAALLKDPKKLHGLLKLVVEHSDRPVTVKIRTGWDKKSVNAREVALYAEDAGVKAVFIHGRTKEQLYSGNVDYNAIRAVKEALNIPVIASGDIFSPELAKKMFDETGCDAVLVARGSMGNPWIFRELETFFKKGVISPRPVKEEIFRVMLEHLNSFVDYHGEKTGVMLFRKFFAWYTKGFRGVRPLRERCSTAKTLKEMEILIRKFKESNESIVEHRIHSHEMP